MISEKKRCAAPGASIPEYVGWRSELLAELALARLPELKVNPLSDSGHAFLVATGQGACFFVDFIGFSSNRKGWDHVEAMRALAWPVDAAVIRRAGENPMPVLLFLLDADTDHFASTPCLCRMSGHLNKHFNFPLKIQLAGHRSRK
jgi:hypothetical protein